MWRAAVMLPLLALACSGSRGASPMGGAGGHGASVGGMGGSPVALGLTRRVRRLSNHEYDNVVRDLLGDSTRPSRGFLIADSFPNGYDNGSDGLVVQSDQVMDYQLAAESLAATAVANRLPVLMNGCDPTSAGDAACLEAFLAYLPPRAFRRPLAASELGRLRTVYAAGAAAGGLSQGIQLVIETLLQSPQFLYREELGAPDAVPAPFGSVALTPYEIASELSFLITGSMPDDQLFAAVRAGQFTGSADYRREALRLLATPAATDCTGRFLHQWLGTDRLSDVVKDAGLYPAFQADPASGVPTAIASMTAELDQDFAALMSAGSGSLRELLSTNQSFADARLAALYGVAAPTASGFGAVTLDPDVRRGILTRLGYLTVHADQDSSGPIARGVFLMSNLLCLTVPPRPATVPSAPSAGDATTAGQTTRQRFTQHLSDDSCRGCHRVIDGFGFGFESFDGIGVYRTSENGQPVDASGTIFGTGDADGDFNGVSDLEQRLLGSARLTDCFVRQSYRFAMGQVESQQPDEVAALAAMATGFSADSRLTDPLLSLVGAPAFTARATGMTSP
jgi:hypothetical protein